MNNNNIEVKLAIRLLKNNNTFASGFYIPLPEQDFDLVGTAKHCLCKKEPEECKCDNPSICNNCQNIDFDTLEFKNEDKTSTLESLNEAPLCIKDRDIAFIKVKKSINNFNNLLINKSEQVTPLKTYGFPSGDSGNGTFKTFNTYTEKNNSILELEFSNNSIGNLETQQTNLAGLSGSGIYSNSGCIFGVYTDTQSTGNGVAVKFDDHLIKYLKSKNISLENSLFETFESYLNGTFEGFETLKKVIENNAKNVIKEISPKEIVNQLGCNIFYSPEFNSVDNLISYLEQNKITNTRLWEGWLQLLSYLKVLQLEIKDTSNITTNLEIEQGGRNYNINIKLNLFFTDKTSYETSQEFIHNKFNCKLHSNNCVIFRSDTDQKERKIFNARKAIIENIAGIDSNVPQNFNFGTVGLSKLSDAVINSENLNQVRVELKKCFQDAIK
ncbi:MAG: hypothetical protein N4A49_06235 [Marinifilaceae bacterium]|jgi:hypothetical protein|nr:hypothetical protein [Marinifilaceae bacterium]